MRILVTGSSGLLGQKLLRALPTELHELHGLDLTDEHDAASPHFTYHRQNLTERRETIELVKRIQPNVIIHTAAMTAVDLCETERERCWNINVKATEYLAAAALKVGARMIYISTDYVFDGTNGPYREEDVPCPISYYGRSKLAGENAIRGASNDWSIIRTIVLYGCGRGVKSSFVTWLLAELRSGRQVKIVNDQWGNATLADDLAAALDRFILMERKGLYHMGGYDFMNRWEFAVRIAGFFGLDEGLISPISTAELNQPARRPLRSGLVTDKAERELYYRFHNTEESLTVYRGCEQEAGEL